MTETARAPPASHPLLDAMDDATLSLIIVLTVLGFCTLAFLLLAPVYLFLKREQKAGEQWTEQILGRPRRGEARASNGSPNGAPTRDAADEQDPAA